MYADFFGFRELPFNNTPDPRFFYSTPDHEEALASLIYAVKERKGFVLLTGEVGAGKTLVTRMMLRHFSTQISFANIHHAVRNSGDLMESICTEFELPFKSGASATQLVRVLHDFLLSQFSQNIPVVLVLDEAQNLPVDAFEQLRMIGNLEADDAKLLQIAIVGQPELQRLFLSPELRQLRQRIFRSFHLPALTREASEGYIRHRLSVVTEDDADTFDAAAIEAVYGFSRGLPRLINTVCDNALLSAYSANRRRIDGRFIDSVIAQMMLVGGRSGPEGKTYQAVTSHPGPDDDTAPALAPARARQQPERWADAASEQPPGDPLARRVEDAGRRVRGIEAHLRTNIPGCGDGTENAPVRPDRRKTRRRQSSAVNRKTLAGIDDLTRRLSAVERRVDASVVDVAEARAIHADLQPLVKEGRSISARMNAVLGQLTERDARLRTLAATIRNMVRDLRHLIEQARKAAAENTRIERSARAAHDRLAGQTRRSRELADELGRLVSSTVCGVAAGPSRLRVPCEGDQQADTPPGPQPDRSAEQGAPAAVRQLLDNTHQSLSGLRYLARRTDRDSGPSTNAARPLPTDRLARQVENLLDMVGEGQAAAQTATSDTPAVSLSP